MVKAMGIFGYDHDIITPSMTQFVKIALHYWSAMGDFPGAIQIDLIRPVFFGPKALLEKEESEQAPAEWKLSESGSAYVKALLAVQP